MWTFEGWLYLAVVMDLHSRQIVGWAMNERMKKQVVLDALGMAYWKKKPKGLLHHSDRGSQYARHDYQKQLVNSNDTQHESKRQLLKQCADRTLFSFP